MISFIDAQGQTFLANLTRIDAANAATESQISSGLTISQPQDSPDQITQLLELQANAAHLASIQTGLTKAQATATSADTALTNTLNLVDQASSLGTEGLGATTTAATRAQLAGQVQSIFQQVVALSQTEVGGRYIFGGDADGSPSYQLDSSQPNGVDRLSTAQNTSEIEDPNGGTFAAGLTAEQIFDARNPDDSLSSNNLFAALNSLYQGLNGDDTNAISSAINSIQQAAAYVNTQQSFYGTLQDRITAAQTTASQLSVNLSAQISGIQDTNVAQAAVQLTQGETAQQAALQAQSKVPTTSLFNFLG